MPVKLFRIDIPLYATAYIKAENEEWALAIADFHLTANASIEFSGRYRSLEDNICMDGRSFECLLDNDEDIALSPAMSFSATRYSPAQIEDIDA